MFLRKQGTLYFQVKCLFCPREYVHQKDCNKHMKNVHAHNVSAAEKQRRVSNQAPAIEFDFTRDIERGQHICRHCSKMFVTAAGRDKHESEHTKPRKFTCSKCGQGFAKVTNKRKHQKRCQTSPDSNEER